MKILTFIILLALPGIAFSQSVQMATSTIIPVPKRDSKGGASKRRAGGKLTITVTKQISPTGEIHTDTTKVTETTAETADDPNNSITIGGTTSDGVTDIHKVTTGGKTVGGTNYNSLTGGETTGGTTIGGITKGGLITGGAAPDAAGNIRGATVTFGKTYGGVTFGGMTKYSAIVVNTNFTIPLVRVNFLVNQPPNATNSLASTSFFNSVGAGINISLGELDVTKDADNNNTSIAFYNHIGLSVGFLFAANSTSASSTTTNSTTTPTSGSNTSGSATTTTSQSSTIFALVAGVAILNFQVGAGYELGSLAPGQRRGFLAISYAIPVSTLINGGYKILGVNKIRKMPQ